MSSYALQEEVFFASWAEISLMWACRDWTMTMSTPGSCNNITETPAGAFHRTSSASLSPQPYRLSWHSSCLGRSVQLYWVPPLSGSPDVWCGWLTSFGCSSGGRDTWSTVSLSRGWRTTGAGPDFVPWLWTHNLFFSFQGYVLVFSSSVVSVERCGPESVKLHCWWVLDPRTHNFPHWWKKTSPSEM